MRLRDRFTIPDSVGNLANRVYERIFHEEMTGGAKDFLRKLSWVAAGTLLATVFSFAFGPLLGRTIGTEGLGEFTLVETYAMFMHVPMILGLAIALVKYASEDDDADRHSRIISTTFILTAFLTITTVIIYFTVAIVITNFASSSSIGEWLQENREILYLSAILAVLLVVYALASNTLRGLDKMKAYALFQPVFTGVSLLAFLILFGYDYFASNDFLDYKSGVYARYVACAITAVIILIFFVRRYLRPKFDRAWAPTLTKYAMFTMLGGLGFVIYTNTDRLLMALIFEGSEGKEMVGIYRAYYHGSIQVIGIVFTMFIAVFFPEASRQGRQQEIIRKINMALPYVIVVGLPLILLALFVDLKLFGKEFPIIFPLMLLFAGTSIMVVWCGLLAWTFNSEGSRGARLAIISTVTIAIVNVILNVLMIPRFELYGAIGSTTISFAIGVILLYLLKGRLTQPEEPETS